MFFGAGAYVPLLIYNLWPEVPPLVGLPLGIAVSVLIAVGIGHAELPAAGPFTSAWRPSRSRSLLRPRRRQLGICSARPLAFRARPRRAAGGT